MWEHRAVSHKQFKESGRITPTETYVQLMDKVEDAVKEAQKMPFDHEEFLKYIPTQGPWEPIHETDDTKGDPRTRYIGPGRPKLLNTNLFLGSTWIESERFKFERRISTLSDFLKQKTVVNANMWTPNNSLPHRRSSSVQQVMKSDWVVPCSLVKLSRVAIHS